MSGNSKIMLAAPLALLMCTAMAPEANASFNIGPLKIGGAIRANYINGDYTDTGSGGPQRGGHGGNFELDTFRVNVDFKQDNWVGKAEYRWYNGYNFLHTGWIGYNFSDNSQVQVGLNRVPFGVGPYGPSNSWFFDQHYYVGLSDDMDMGVKYTTKFGKLALDLAYYGMDEPDFNGHSKESARYSYDIVDNGGEYSHYEERNQFNVRAIYSLASVRIADRCRRLPAVGPAEGQRGLCQRQSMPGPLRCTARPPWATGSSSCS